MKYALLIHDVPGAWKDLGEEERTAIMGEYLAITRHPGHRRRRAAAGGSDGHHGARLRRLTVTSGGPVADTEEYFGGFYMLHDDLDAAIGTGVANPGRPHGVAPSRSARWWSFSA